MQVEVERVEGGGVRVLWLGSGTFSDLGRHPACYALIFSQPHATPCGAHGTMDGRTDRWMDRWVHAWVDRRGGSRLEKTADRLENQGRVVDESYKVAGPSAVLDLQAEGRKRTGRWMEGRLDGCGEWDLFARSVCEICSRGLFAGSVCGVCLRGLFAGSVCGVCLRGLFAGSVCGVCLRVRYLFVGSLCGVCLRDLLARSVYGVFCGVCLRDLLAPCQAGGRLPALPGSGLWPPFGSNGCRRGVRTCCGVSGDHGAARLTAQLALEAGSRADVRHSHGLGAWPSIPRP
eukprot:358476-Chlamydomonas_euryale.AAC.4